MLAHLDLRWITATSFCVIGLSLIMTGVRLWWMPPTRRAQIFCPFLKERGVLFVLRAWPLTFVMGVFMLFAGLSKEVYYARWHGRADTELANAIGTVEALVSVWAATSLLIVLHRAWRSK